MLSIHWAPMQSLEPLFADPLQRKSPEKIIPVMIGTAMACYGEEVKTRSLVAEEVGVVCTFITIKLYNKDSAMISLIIIVQVVMSLCSDVDAVIGAVRG